MIDGLDADVVTLALAADIDAIAEKSGKIAGRLADAAAATTRRPTPRPSSSSSARAIRRASRTGAIWSRPASQVITPNPKTSGGARWNYLAAWAYADAEVRRRRGQGRATSSRALFQQRAGARHRRARLDHDLRPARHRRRAARLGERGLPRAARSSAPTSSRSSCRRSRSWPSRRSRVVDGNVDAQGHAQGGRGLSRLPLQRRGAEDHRQELLPAGQARRPPIRPT